MRFNVRIFSFCLLFMLASCTSYKKVPYFQMKGSKKNDINIPSLFQEGTTRIQPDDVLGITLNVVGNSNVAYDYNLPLQPAAQSADDENVNMGMSRQTYLVTKEGKIDFPVLGQIRVVGYTPSELEQYIKKLVYPKQLKVEPVVSVRLMNFRLTITGEVNKPGQISVNKDHINILEALALAGDMTIYGKRDDVQLLREMPDGTMKKVRLDISKAEIISSPYFYLRQNDVLYVVPNNARAQYADSSPQLGTILGAGSFLISVVSFVLLISQK